MSYMARLYEALEEISDEIEAQAENENWHKKTYRKAFREYMLNLSERIDTAINRVPREQRKKEV